MNTSRRKFFSRLLQAGAAFSVAGNAWSSSRSNESASERFSFLADVDEALQNVHLSRARVITSTGDQALAMALDKRVIFVDSITKMMEMDIENLMDGQLVYVSGSRGGMFQWLADNTSQPNGGVIFQPFASDVGRFYRHHAGVIKAEWFGVTPYHDQSDNIQAAIDYAAMLGGGIVELDEGEFTASGIVIRNRVVLRGQGRLRTYIAAPDGWTDSSIIETQNFASESLRSAGVAELSVLGNADNFGGLPSAGQGNGIRLHSTDMVLYEVGYADIPGGAGLHTKGASSLPNLRGIRGQRARYDGWVFEGPSDARIDDVEIGRSGYPDDTFSRVRESLIVPGERVANFRVAKSCDIGFIHAYGCREGWSVVFGAFDENESIRVKATHLIAESSNGGLRIDKAVRHQLGIVDSHNNYGVDGAPYLLNRSEAPSIISNLEVFDNFNGHGQDKVVIEGQWQVLDSVTVHGANQPGHALVVGGWNNSVGNAQIRQCSGSAMSGEPSHGVVVRSANAWQVREAIVNSCDGIVLIDGSAHARDSHFTDGYGNKSYFNGIDQLSLAERRRVKFHRRSGGARESHFAVESGEITASDTRDHSLTLFVAMHAPPMPDMVQITPHYVRGSYASFRYLYVDFAASSRDRLILRYAFAEANNGTVKALISVG